MKTSPVDSTDLTSAEERLQLSQTSRPNLPCVPRSARLQLYKIRQQAMAVSARGLALALALAMAASCWLQASGSQSGEWVCHVFHEMNSWELDLCVVSGAREGFDLLTHRTLVNCSDSQPPARGRGRREAPGPAPTLAPAAPTLAAPHGLLRKMLSGAASAGEGGHSTRN